MKTQSDWSVKLANDAQIKGGQARSDSDTAEAACVAALALIAILAFSVAAWALSRLS